MTKNIINNNLTDKQINDIFADYFPKEIFNTYETTFLPETFNKIPIEDFPHGYLTNVIALAYLTEKFGKSHLSFNDDDLKNIKLGLTTIMSVVFRVHNPNNKQS